MDATSPEHVPDVHAVKEYLEEQGLSRAQNWVKSKQELPPKVLTSQDLR